MSAFLHGDGHSPVVLGCFWNPANGLPQEIDTEKNTEKLALTKGGHLIRLTDGEKGGVSIQTKAGHTIVISDENETITCATKDQNQTIVLDQKKKMISVQSSDNITMKSKEITMEGKIVMKGDSISLQADGELSLKGQTLKAEGASTKMSGRPSRSVERDQPRSIAAVCWS